MIPSFQTSDLDWARVLRRAPFYRVVCLAELYHGIDGTQRLPDRMSIWLFRDRAKAPLSSSPHPNFWQQRGGGGFAVVPSYDLPSYARASLMVGLATLEVLRRDAITGAWVVAFCQVQPGPDPRGDLALSLFT